MVTVKLRFRQCVITFLDNFIFSWKYPNFFFLPCSDSALSFHSFSFPLLLLFFFSPSPLPSDCLSHLCWPSAFLLLGCLLLDVSGGCATLSHAGGGLWERVLPQKVLLSVRILLPRTGGGHLRGHRLQELWDQESVRVKTGLLHLQIEK